MKETWHKSPHNCMIPFIWNVQNMGIHRGRKYIDDIQGLWEGKMGVTISRHGVSFQGDENVLELDSGDGCIALQIYCTSLNYVYTLKKWILDYVDYTSKEKQKQREMASEVPGKCNKQSTPLSLGSASWACGLCSHQKGPVLDSTLCYHCFEILFF